ncbi:4101_t:CDS:2, partial [Gigaspora margarita]
LLKAYTNFTLLKICMLAYGCEVIGSSKNTILRPLQHWSNLEDMRALSEAPYKTSTLQ